MTPKDKAEELVEKFVSLDNDIFCSVNYPYSKQCALIAVDFAIQYNDFHIEFLQEVKQEIIKL